jgi:hypothetical protein
LLVELDDELEIVAGRRPDARRLPVVARQCRRRLVGGAFEAGERAVHHEAELLVQRLAEWRRVESDGAHVLHLLEATMEQGGADAAPARRGIHQHHGDPGEVRRISHRRHGSDDGAGLVDRDGGAAGRQPEELLPVTRQLVPVAQPTQAQSRLDVGLGHRAQGHRHASVQTLDYRA